MYLYWIQGCCLLDPVSPVLEAASGIQHAGSRIQYPGYRMLPFTRKQKELASIPLIMPHPLPHIPALA